MCVGKERCAAADAAPSRTASASAAPGATHHHTAAIRLPSYTWWRPSPTAIAHDARPSGLTVEPSSHALEHPAARDARVRGWALELREVPGLVRDTLSAWLDDHAPSMGAALAYYTLFSIAPLLLIVIAVAGAVFGTEAAEG